MAWQHVSPVFRFRESDGVATRCSGLARLVGTVSPLSGGVHESSNPGFSGTRRPRRGPSSRSADNARRGRKTERSFRLRGRNEPLKGEAHGRYRRETEPEGFREEQSARRLRKPEGAAQPGEVNPVQVASRCLMRRRVNQPHEGSVVRRRLVSGHRAVWRNTVDPTLERSPSSREDGKVLRVPDRRVFREYLTGRFARPRP